MKTKFLLLLFPLSLALAATAAAQSVNVQKAASTNAITGNLTIGTGKILLGDTGSVTNFATVGVGTGTTAPATMLQVIDTGTGTPRGISNDQYNSGTQSAQINLRKARGTFATPTTIVTGDILSRVITWGYDGSNFIESGNLRVTSSGTIAATRVPSQMEFYTSTNATPSVLTQWETIFSNGNHAFGGRTSNGTGVMQLPAATTSAGGINFGDTYFLYASPNTSISLASTNDPALYFHNGSSGQDPGVIETASNNFFVSARSGSLILRTNSTTTAITIDTSQNSTFAGRAIGASFGTATAAAAVLRYNSSAAISINNATATGLQFNGYGAGTITSDASGNLTSISDSRWKDISGDFTRGLAAVRQLRPKTYHWKKESGLDAKELNAGFIAQEVLPVIPEAVSQGPDGFYSFADRPITAALVNAVNELDQKPTADWWARGLGGAALLLALRANLRTRDKFSPYGTVESGTKPHE